VHRCARTRRNGSRLADPGRFFELNEHVFEPGRALANGETFALEDEVQRCFDIRPTWTPETRFEEAHALFDEALPGQESIAERLQALRNRYSLASEKAGLTIDFMRRAMNEALAGLPQAPAHVLVDGLHVRGRSYQHTPIVRGDATCLSIAAASIIAKVTRDRLMLHLDKQYPAYGFAQHKGYGTEAHLAALRTHGASPIHRQSFAPVRELYGLFETT